MSQELGLSGSLTTDARNTSNSATPRSAQWTAPSLADTDLSDPGPALELHRAQITDRRVPSRIVEALDVVEHIGLRLVSAPVRLGRRSHGPERREEALHRRIVPHVARAAHRADDAMIGHQPLELLVSGCKRTAAQQELIERRRTEQEELLTQYENTQSMFEVDLFRLSQRE